jgi:hypothetical protein
VADAPRATILAATAATCAVGGVAAVTLAVLAGPGPGFDGYVSEAGIASSAYAPVYRLGVFALAAALLLLAASFPAALRVVAALLGAAALATVLSAAVTCSDGCPLPPFERATVADLVHGGASITAVASSVLAMLALAAAPPAARSLRRLATVAAVVAVPLSALVGVAMLAVGRSPLVGLVERLLLVDTALWALVTAVTIGIRNGAARRAPAPAQVAPGPAGPPPPIPPTTP